MASRNYFWGLGRVGFELHHFVLAMKRYKNIKEYQLKLQVVNFYSFTSEHFEV